VPVIAKTVHMRVISPYHFNVPLGGISFGPSHRCKNVELSVFEDEDPSFLILDNNLFWISVTLSENLACDTFDDLVCMITCFPKDMPLSRIGLYRINLAENII
jgi:hypothetical protein